MTDTKLTSNPVAPLAQNSSQIPSPDTALFHRRVSDELFKDLRVAQQAESIPQVRHEGSIIDMNSVTLTSLTEIAQ